MMIGFVGLGNIGCAMAHLVASNGHDVVGWEYDAAVVEEINTTHHNSRFLPDIALSPRLRATQNLADVCTSCDVVFVALPSLYIHRTLEQVQVDKRSVLVNLAKGIDGNTGLTAFQTLSELFPHHARVMLAGPAIANEFARGKQTVVVLAGHDMGTLLRVSRVLDNDFFRTRFSDDCVGVEWGGILKNVYTIGLGLFDGRHIKSVNIRSVYLTIALEEIGRLGIALGGKAESFGYLAGMGDLLATSLSMDSHNRRMGELLAEGKTLEEVQATMGMVPEGYHTMQFALSLAEKLHVPMPLARGLWDVLRGKRSTEAFLFSCARDFVG